MIFTRGTYRRWRTTEPVTWNVGNKYSHWKLTIPAGREFESSVPWWARWILSQDDPRFLLAALIHDVMLEEGVYGRPQAAAEWYDAALAGGAPRWLAIPAFLAVAAWAVIRHDSHEDAVA